MAGWKGRSRHDRQLKLPIYEKPRTPSRERSSDDSYDNDTESEYHDYSSASSPDTSTSRYTFNTAAQAVPILSRPTPSRMGRPRQRRLYRLPNRIVRYLCLGLASLIILMIISLARASYLENLPAPEKKPVPENKPEEPDIKPKPVVKPPPPHLWESFPFLTRYYGGIRTLAGPAENVPEYPREKDEAPIENLQPVEGAGEPGSDAPQKRSLPVSKEFIAHPQSVFQTAPEKLNECFLDEEKTVRVPPIRYYEGKPKGFPQPVMGSYELFGFPDDICFERFGKYAPYGHGYSLKAGGQGTGDHGDKEGLESTWEKVPRVNWTSVDWAETQRRCYQSNAARYKPLPASQPSPQGFYINDKPATKRLVARDAVIDDEPESSPRPSAKTGTKPKAYKDKEAEQAEKTGATAKPLPRTAIVVRCWDEFVWRDEDIINFRSLITELALASGGRYDVHLLVQVKDDGAHPIWADADTYQRRIEETVPAEFRGLVTFWSQTQMLAIYQGIHDLWTKGPDLPVHGVYRGLQMAMQYFAYQHPEYDYFWQWEMDVRYIGHYYDLVTKVERWAKQQPRKGLWERNARFYIPSVHGSWEDFKQMARVQTEMGVKGIDNVWDGVPGTENGLKGTLGEKPIWGPQRPKDERDWLEPENDPVPPTTHERDRYKWGVGEEADYITFNPLFDPERTTWGLVNDITGYHEDDGVGKPPRRAQIVTFSRMSRKLLLIMHRETAFLKHHAFSEMWPGTAALHHGLKAVYAPHPVYVDREWPTRLFAQTLNNGRNGASGGSRTAVYGDREHNLEGLSWHYRSGFAHNLYRRWQGLVVNNDGGEEFELAVDESKDGSTVGEMRGGEGRMCLPPMLIHPVKKVELPVEHPVEEVKIPDSDPGA
ncbi:hypothetical protein F5Y17DRAFT_422099 [Xylariaceae sp. FL0594]|nr:hypothetical protein F5Y17DRAFT_422099 [Xylariaceae sp. FL0594]